MADEYDASTVSAASTELTRRFIDNRAGKFHDAFGVESHFNVAMSKYQSKDTSDLEEMLKRFQRLAPDQVDFDFDLLHCTWHDVFNELEKTHAAVSESNRRGKKPHRRVWQAMGTIGDILAPGLVALPNDLCVLQGGLAVIFSLARQRFMNREKLLRAFEDIPSVIMMAYGKAESIPRDQAGSFRLHGMIRQLQKTLLRILPILIVKLNPDTFFAKATSAFRGFDIDELLAEVRSTSERVRVCAEGIMDSMTISAHQTIDDNYKMSNDIYNITQEAKEEVISAQQTIDDNYKMSKDIYTITQETKEEVVSAQQSIDDNYKMSKDIYTITQETKEEVVSAHQSINENRKMSEDIHMITLQTEEGVGELREKIDEILKHQRSFQTTLDAVSGKNGLLNFIMEHLKPKQQDEEMTATETLPLYEPATPLTPRQLLGRMNVDHLGALEDEQHIIRRGHSLNREAISHAASMFQTTQVQHLLHSQESCVVLVNGCSDRSQNTKISPITHVCATLTHALRCSDSASVVLAFFCGQHTTSEDDLVGPQGLMRSLIANLLLSLIQNECISESAPIWVPVFQGDFEELSFELICQLFYHLVELVPKQIMVYCVVDGISYYERDLWKGDYDLMMECFGSIIANEAITAVFKLLLTSPTVSRWLPDLTPHQRVSLRNVRVRGAANPETYLKSAGI